MNGRGERLVIKKESYQYPVGLPGRLLLASFTFIAQKFCFCKGGKSEDCRLQIVDRR